MDCKHQRPAKMDCETCSTKEHNPLCSVPEAQELVEKSRSTSRLKAGQTLFFAGEDPTGLFTVREGLVKLETISDDGSAHTLRLMGPGSALGHRSLFAGEPYRASAVAVEDCELCFLPRNDLMMIFSRFPQVALNLLQQLSKDLRQAEDKWIQQMDKDAPARVAEALLFLHDHFMDQQWTRREIAEWAGTTPETVMRTLALFEKNGLIEQQGRNIRLKDRQKISEKAKGT